MALPVWLSLSLFVLGKAILVLAFGLDKRPPGFISGHYHVKWTHKLGSYRGELKKVVEEKKLHLNADRHERRLMQGQNRNKDHIQGLCVGSFLVSLILHIKSLLPLSLFIHFYKTVFWAETPTTQWVLSASWWMLKQFWNNYNHSPQNRSNAVWARIQVRGEDWRWHRPRPSWLPDDRPGKEKKKGKNNGIDIVS